MLSSINISGQVSLSVSENYCQLSSSEKDKCSELIKVIENAFQKYVQYATLYDPSEGRVTEEYIDKFTDLFYFESSHKIFDDAGIRCTKSISVGDYTDRAYFTFRNQGYQFNIEKAKLISLRRSADSYKATIELSKKVMLNGLDEKGDVIAYRKGRVFGKDGQASHTIEYDIPIDNFKLINIEKLRGTCATISRQKIIASVYGGTTLSSSGDALTIPQIEIQSSSSTLMGGVDVRFNLGEKNPFSKKIYVIGGFAYNQYTTELTFDGNCSDCIVPKVDDPNTDKDDVIGDYTLSYSINNSVIEQSKLKGIGGTIGLGYELVAWEKGQVFLDALLMPMQLSGSPGSLEGNITYTDLSYQGLDWKISLDEAPSDAAKETLRKNYGLGELSLMKEIAALESEFKLGYRFQLGTNIYFSESIGMTAGIFYDILDTSVNTTSRSIDIPFLNVLDLNNNASEINSLIESYGIKHNPSLGFKLGLFIHFEKEKYKF